VADHGQGPDPSVPPGWYEDPLAAAQWRYWDGQQWTGHVAPREDAAQASAWSAASLGGRESAHETAPVAYPLPDATDAVEWPPQGPGTWPGPDVPLAEEGLEGPPPPSEDLIADPAMGPVERSASGGRAPLWLVLGLVVGIGAGLALGYALWGWDDSPISLRTGTVDQDAVSELGPARDEASDADESAANETDPREDDGQASDQDGTGSLHPAAMQQALDEYVASISAGRLDAAHDIVSDALRREDGWSYERFVDFHANDIADSRLVRFDAVDGEQQAIIATIDFTLPDGDVSRETVRTEWTRAADGQARLDGYEVLASERVD